MKKPPSTLLLGKCDKGKVPQDKRAYLSPYHQGLPLAQQNRLLLDLIMI